MYQFGFEELKRYKSHFDVRKGNERVISFHQKMGATQIGESKEDYYFEITQSAVKAARQRLKGKIS